MKTYTITASGTTMGSYHGETRDDAILGYVHDAGYRSIADAAYVCAQTEAEFLADITATEDAS